APYPRPKTGAEPLQQLLRVAYASSNPLWSDAPPSRTPTRGRAYRFRPPMGTYVRDVGGLPVRRAPAFAQERQPVGVAEAVARDMPHVPLEDALRLTSLYVAPGYSSSGSTGVSAAQPARCVIQIAYSDMKPTNQRAWRNAIQRTRPTVNHRIVSQ